MNEEAGFNLLLDQNPEDSITRAVYADWLEEQGRYWHFGYRWMVETGRHSTRIKYTNKWVVHMEFYPKSREVFRLICKFPNCFSTGFSCVFDTRKQADDALAKAVTFYKDEL